MKPLTIISALLTLAALMLPLTASADIFTDDEIANSFSIKEISDMPKPVTQDAPDIPAELRREKGTIQVAFVLGADGKVLNPRVAKSTNDSLNDVALKTVGKWAFEPARKDANPVPVRIVVPLRFK